MEINVNNKNKGEDLGSEDDLDKLDKDNKAGELEDLGSNSESVSSNEDNSNTRKEEDSKDKEIKGNDKEEDVNTKLNKEDSNPDMDVDQ